MRPLTSRSGVRASLGAFLVAFGRLGAPFAVWVLGGCFTNGRDSSAGRASDPRSEGPRFDPGSRQFWGCMFALRCDFRRLVCMVSFVVAGFVSGTMGWSCFGNLACQAGFQFVCALCVCVCVWLGSACCCYRSNSNAAQHIETISGPVAQWIRHRPTEPGIAGSSPAGVICRARAATISLARANFSSRRIRS